MGRTRGASTKRAGRAPRPTSKVPVTNVPVTREEFFASFGRDPDDHERYSQTGEIAAYAMQRASACSESDPRCGWWWCRPNQTQHPRTWQDLSEALAILRVNKIDPEGPDVARVAGKFGLLSLQAEDKAAAKKAYAVIDKLLRRNDIPNGGWVRGALEECRDKLQPWPEAFAAAKPDKGSPGAGQKRPLQWASLEAAWLGWTSEVFAAVLLLVGADRSKLSARKHTISQYWSRLHLNKIADEYRLRQSSH